MSMNGLFQALHVLMQREISDRVYRFLVVRYPPAIGGQGKNETL